MATQNETTTVQEDDKAAVDQNQTQETEFDEDAAFTEFAQLLDDKAESSEPKPEPESAPAGEPAEAETPDGQKLAQTTEQSVTTNGSDIWSNASEEHRRAYEEMARKAARAEHAFQSNRNRLGAYHRKLNAAEAELEQYRKQLQQRQPTDQSQGQPETAKTSDDSIQVDLKTFQEDFPEVYAAMRALQNQEVTAIKQDFQSKLSQIEQQLQGVSQPIQELAADRETQFKQSQLATLAAVHPDYEQIQGSNHFWQWIDQQTPGVRALVSSTAAEDNIALLNFYKQQNGVMPTAAPQQQQPATRSPSQAPRRPRSAEAGEALPRAGTSAPSGMPESEDAAWDYWVQQAEQGRL